MAAARLALITHLDEGAHGSIDDGACLMEAVAYVAGKPWSDRPACASPVLAAFGRAWNDALPDAERQELLRYVPLLIGSRGSDEQEEARAYMALDWLIREHTPAWLDLAGLTQHAAALRDLAPIRSLDAADAAGPVVRAARAAAWAAARAAAWDAAGDAAGAAAGERLRPTRDALIRSAHVLYSRMIAAGPHGGGA